MDEETIQLREDDNGRPELIFPDGTSNKPLTYHVEECSVAAVGHKDVIAVFIEGEYSFTINEYVKLLSPLNRAIAVSPSGYIAYHSGEHRENVFNLRTWDGETVLQRIVDVARTPSFTPDGEYVAFWRLTDRTIYCYDVEAASESGRFDTATLRKTNIGVTGITHEGEPAFAVSDTSGQGEDELLGHISPTGELIQSHT